MLLWRIAVMILHRRVLMRNSRSLISASEVSDYVFCALAWRLRTEGRETDALQAAQEAGTKWHHYHGIAVRRVRKLRVAAVILLTAAIFLTLLVLYLALR